MTKMNLFTVLTVITVLAFILPTHAADEPPPSQPWEKVSVRLGGSISSLDTSVEFGLDRLGGIKLDAEDILGLDSTLTIFQLDALYRPGKSRRHQFDLSYESYDRSGRKTLTEEIEIDGETLLPGTEISSTLDLTIIRGTYSYALLQDDRMRIALGLGIYVLPLRYGVSIEEDSDDRSLEYRDITVPLPSLALRGDFLLVPKLFLTTELNLMYLEYEQFEGSLVDTSIGLEYRPWEHVGFGVAYSALSVHVQGEGETSYPGADLAGSVDIDFSGLMLFGKITF